MGVVHGLEGDAGVIAVEVAVLDEILDGVDDLEGLSAWMRCERRRDPPSYLLQQLCLLETCFQHCNGISGVFA